MPDVHVKGGYQKQRMPNFEASIRSAYGKNVQVYAENRCDDQGRLAFCTRWFIKNGTQVVMRECLDCDKCDTHHVEVILNGHLIKEFLQGQCNEDCEKDCDNHCENNAFVEAERYAMGLI